MKTIKEIKPKTKEKLIVDLAHIEDEDDVRMAFIIAKVNQGKVITPTELEIVVEYVTKVTVHEFETAIATMAETINKLCNHKPKKKEKKKKKENIFRRFWRWLTGK